MGDLEERERTGSQAVISLKVGVAGCFLETSGFLHMASDH